MRWSIGIFILLALVLKIEGQSTTDSLIKSFNTTTNDSIRIYDAIRLYDIMINSYPDSLYSFITEALPIAKEKGYQKEAVKLLELEGQLYIRLNDFPEGQKRFFEAGKLLDSIKGNIPDTSYLKRTISIQNNIAIIYFHSRKLEDAKNTYLNMIRSLEKNPETEMLPWIRKLYMVSYQNLGSVYLQLLDYDHAESYYLKALSYMAPDNIKAMATIFNNLGIIEKDRDHFDKSLDYLTRAARLSRESGNDEVLVQSLNNMGNLLVKMKRYKDALDTIQKARRIAASKKFLRSEVISVQLLAGIHAELGDYRNAYLANTEYQSLNDSLLKQENLKSLTQLESQQRFEKKLREEKMLHQQEELKRQKRDTAYLFITITALLLFAILVMLYALQRSKLKRHRLMAEKDALNRKSLELENDKLSIELEYKNKELTTNVIYLARTNEFIASLAEKLIKSKLSFNKDNQKLIDEFVRELKMYADRDTWKEFEIRFQDVHKDFYTRLNERFPDLSANEKKLCAFLRLNMTTKEISAITYQSVNSITVARSRLRKKMGIDKDDNLIAFLEQL